jgi:hypothetical protein
MSEQIEKAVEKLKIPEWTGPRYCIYFYALIMDNKACVKAGRTKKSIPERFNKYLMTEHGYQNKDMNTFVTLGVFEFENEQMAKSAENLFKAEFKKHPLNVGQHGNMEQYLLRHLRDRVNTYLMIFTHFTNYWVNPDADKEMGKLLVLEATLPIQTVPRYVLRSATQVTVDEKPVTRIAVDDRPAVRDKVDDRPAVRDKVDDRPVVTKVKLWVTNLDSLISGKKHIIEVGKPGKSKIIEALKVVRNQYNSNELLKEFNGTCFEKRMKAYNKANGRAVRFSVVTKYLQNC